MTRNPSFLLITAILLAAACSEKGSGEADAILLSARDIQERPADLPGKTRERTIEKSPAVGVYHVETDRRLIGLRFNPYAAVRIVLLKGRMKIRVGSAEKVLGPGGFVSVPPDVKYRILRLGEDPLGYMLLVSPNIPRHLIAERGSSVNSLPESGGPGPS